MARNSVKYPWRALANAGGMRFLSDWVWMAFSDWSDSFECLLYEKMAARDQEPTVQFAVRGDVPAGQTVHIT